MRRLAAAALVACLAHACATPDDQETKRRHGDPNSSRFEWAVQHYEAGNYPKAIASFESLHQEGASLAGYDLIPFYVGMSQFHLGHFDLAARELEAFVRSGTARPEAQEARIALLLSYEKLGRWKETAALAMETDKLTLFQNNRALLKLVWARALREQGELLGAKAALDEALPYLDQAGPDDAGQASYADPNQDLWGRYHYASILVQETECQKLAPKELPTTVAVVKEGKKTHKPGRPKRLYAAWLGAETDCQRKVVEHAARDLFVRESAWEDGVSEAIRQGIEAFGGQIRGFLKEEARSLQVRRALEKDARENLYRLLNTIEEQLKNFKYQDIVSDPLESLRKQVDRLLVSISHPS